MTIASIAGSERHLRCKQLQLSFGLGSLGSVFAFGFLAFGTNLYGMNDPSPISLQPPSAEKLALAQRAFTRFYTRCFWFLREDLIVDKDNLELVIRGLRTHGNREAFLVAAQLCR